MDLEEQLKLLPDRPGCYLYRDAAGRILYVGKAVSLRQRVRQYFQASRNLPPKVQLLVPQIARIEHIVTENEVEALILESNLIKRHKPKYNIRLRDDKHYPYIRLTLAEKWPRLLIARQMRSDGSRYFGPYTTAGAVHETLKLLRRICPLRTCNDPSRHPRACLQWHIGRCLAPCLADFNRHGEYARAVEDVVAFLEGKVDSLLQRLRAQMEAAAENLEFERAAELRDQIRAVEKVAERQKIITADLTDRDVIGWVREDDEACIQVFFVRAGKLVGRDTFFMGNAAGLAPAEILSAFIQQHYHRTTFIPPEILLSDPLGAAADLLSRWLSQRRGSKVAVQAPRRGEKRQLLAMVLENAAMAMAERRQERARDAAAGAGALAELQQALGLPALPYRIECFDIAHIQGTDVVAAMAVFEDGEPKKGDYRRFKMRVDANNDFASMAEAIARRFRRGLAEQEARAAEAPAAYGAGQVEAPRFAVFPDLLIIDGGKGQLNAALQALAALGLDGRFPVFGLAKEEELLYAPGRSEPIALPRRSPALFLLQRLRDETHRFGNTYHRKLRSQGLSRSILDAAPGIGPRRKQALLRHFGSLTRIRAASVAELAAVPGMNREVAERLAEFLEQQP